MAFGGAHFLHCLCSKMTHINYKALDLAFIWPIIIPINMNMNNRNKKTVQKKLLLPAVHLSAPWRRGEWRGESNISSSLFFTLLLRERGREHFTNLPSSCRARQMDPPVWNP